MIFKRGFMDIQYYHQKTNESLDVLFLNQTRFTAVVQVPSTKTLLDLFTTVNKKITLNLGIALVHPNDEYVKSVGRAVANERLAPVELELGYGRVEPAPDTGDYIYDAILHNEDRSITVELRYKEHYFRPILRAVYITR